MTTPGLFDIVPAVADQPWPEPVNPYFLLSKDGFFLHKKTQIGTALIPIKGVPDHLPKIDKPRGFFQIQMPKIPASVMGQVFDFFHRTYNKIGAEAEVILTFAESADPQWKVFIPTQRVSGAGVRSIYEPLHIKRPYRVVGSIHSHCDFSAFHSGTDTADASEFPGLHITIGNVNRDTGPSIATMFMFNGVQFNAQIEDVADISELGKHTAPEWWDRYLNKDPSIVKAKSITQADLDTYHGRAPYRPTNGSNWSYTPSSYQLPAPYHSGNARKQWLDDQIDTAPTWADMRLALIERYGNGEWDLTDEEVEELLDLHYGRVWDLAEDDSRPEPKNVTPKTTTTPPPAANTDFQWNGWISGQRDMTWAKELGRYVRKDLLHPKTFTFVSKEAIAEAVADALFDLDHHLRERYGVKLWYDVFDAKTQETMLYDDPFGVKVIANNLDE